MKLFIYEHLTSGALLNAPQSEALLAEGDAMIRAIITDLLQLGGQIHLLRDARLPTFDPHPALNVQNIHSPQAFLAAWQQTLNNDYPLLLIAPETEHILYSLAQQAEQHHRLILGSTSKAIALTGDKLACFQQLKKHQLLTADSYLATDWNAPESAHDWIIKPIHGAGCEQTYRFSASALQCYIEQLRNPQAFMVQPYIEGLNLSLSLCIAGENIELLSVNQQDIACHDHRLSLTHSLPGQNHLLSSHLAMRLARSVIRAFPGLNGFIGIDLIKQGDKLYIIDINPRLTSAYANPLMRAHRNPAQFFYKHFHDDNR